MKKSDIVGMIAYYTLTLLFGSTVGVLSLIIKENSDRIVYYEGQWNKGDYLKSSIADEQHLAMYVKDVVDDADAGDGEIMRKWHAAMDARGEIVEWDEIV